MTDLGSETSPLSMTGEQWVHETRTDDPASPAPDERWIRTDLNEGDRVATLKCGDGTEIPLFPVGLAEETVREARRFHVGGETVFAPLAPLDDASFPERRFQHDGQLHAFHDRVAPGSAIPDSEGSHQWNVDEGIGNTLADSIGTLDASLVNSPAWSSSAGAGGGHIVFNGTDQYGDLGSSSRTEFKHFTENGRGTVFAWFKPETASNNEIILGNSLSFNVGFFIRYASDSFSGFIHADSTSIAGANGSTTLTTGEWYAGAMTADESDLRIYLAGPSDDYTLGEEGTDPIDSGALTTSDLGSNLNFARDSGNNNGHFDGGIDYTFTDTVSRSQENLQQLVDDTKGFYQ